MKKNYLILIVIMAVLFLLVGSATAWGKSLNVAAVDDETGASALYVNSYNMDALVYSDFTTPMTTVEPGNVNAATLANYDTLLLFACNPNVFSAGQKADIVAFVKGGGKLVIWDSEDPGAGNSWNYNWLPSPFATSCPGATGVFTGTLNILEENTLSSADSSSSYYIDTLKLTTQTDAVADSNVFTTYLPTDWCVDMEATNVLNQFGPNHVYTNTKAGKVGTGIVIYSGLDWDYSDVQAGADLVKMVQQEFDTSTLPCLITPTPSLDVTKVVDKTVYNVDDTVTFTVRVTNPGTFTAEDVELVDSPPAEVSLSQTVYVLGDIAPGASAQVDIVGKAVKEGCDLKNEVIASGLYKGVPFFSGGATATFDIGTNCKPISTPEFPTLALPIAMIIGIVFIVYSVKRKE
jgi:uncharacterized repeat protein (TIGR01451 family)